MSQRRVTQRQYVETYGRFDTIRRKGIVDVMRNGCR
jgi:hypothetical protein